MNMHNLLAFILLAMIKLGFSSNEDETTNAATIVKDCNYRLSEASNKFGFNLLANLAAEKTKNILFSPISLSTTLGLIYYGSRGNTQKELENLLGYKDSNLTRTEVALAFQYLLNYHLITVEPRAYVLDMATAMFVNKYLGLNSTYEKEVKEIFRSQIETIDLANEGAEAVNRINAWVRNKTRDKIVGIVDDLDPSEDLVAANALYFKSKWLYTFKDTDTRSEFFYNGGTIGKTVSMMSLEKTIMHYEDDNLGLVHLSFWGRNVSMIIILPHQSDGLLEIERSLTQDKLIHYLINASPKRVHLKLPKFKMSYSADLVPILQDMGATDTFQTNLANLSGMIIGDNVAVGEVRHKAIIDVNESGVEAAGITATISFKSMPLMERKMKKFTVDHPFLFVILDERTDLVLMIGRVWSL